MEYCIASSYHITRDINNNIKINNICSEPDLLNNSDIDKLSDAILTSPINDSFEDDTVKNSENKKSNIDLTPKKTIVRKRLGEQLIEKGLINQGQLSAALSESKASGVPVGSVLVKLGFITGEQLRENLSTQQGIESFEINNLQIEPELMKLLPAEFIKENKVIPISSDGRSLVIGMVNPNDKKLINDIIYLTGLEPSPMIITYIDFEKYAAQLSNTKSESTKKESAEKLIDEIIKDKDFNFGGEDIGTQLEREFKDDVNVVAKFASSIITEGIEGKASDIHIEPRIENYIVRYRVDGILSKVLEIPNKIGPQLFSRFKVLAKMNISEHRRSQDGSFSFRYNDKVYDFRINTLPVAQKEKMVIRILKPEVKMTQPDEKISLPGATHDDAVKINKMTTSPHGIILTTGPTGSGKSTTLYSILTKLNKESINITTIEDPVEIKLEGINQVQVNPKADVTFASCMRSMLRQDPDIIMIGEIRDYETFEAAMHASLTGHLVISTFHANSASATITRLIEMGAPPHMISASLIGIIAQRLVRKLCPNCKEIYEPNEEELKIILRNLDKSIIENKKIYAPKGCPQCNNKGYLGRIGVYEVMPINRELKKMFLKSPAAHEIEEVAISCGMKNLHNACLETIISGETSVDEFIRVLGAADE